MAQLHTLRAYELIEGDGEYTPIDGTMRAAGPSESAEHVLEGIRILSQTVAPHLIRADAKAMMVLSTMNVVSASKSQKALAEALRAVWESESSDDGEEQVVLLFATAHDVD